MYIYLNMNASVSFRHATAPLVLSSNVASPQLLELYVPSGAGAPRTEACLVSRESS